LMAIHQTTPMAQQANSSSSDFLELVDAQ